MEESFEYLKLNWFDNSYVKMISAVFIMSMTVVLKIIFVKSFNRFITKKASDLHNDPTNYKFLKHTISALIYIVGFSIAIYMIPSLRTIAGSMLAGAGILAVAIGFASQQAFSNIISGVFIILFKPFRVNDRIQVQNTTIGVVEDITLRHTVIRNFENRRVVIPNSVISQESLINANLVDDKICRIIDFGVAYKTNLKDAKRIIAEEAMAHPNFIDNRTDEQKQKNEPPVTVRVTAWLDSAIQIRLWVWAKDSPSAFIMGCDLHESIKERFDQEGVEIPFPHRKVVQQS